LSSSRWAATAEFAVAEGPLEAGTLGLATSERRRLPALYAAGAQRLIVQGYAAPPAEPSDEG